MKRLAEQAAYIATLEPDFQKLSDDELRGDDRRVPAAARERRVARGAPLRGVRRRARGALARVAAAHVRRPDDGRHRPARGRHRRDEDRRGQDLRREPRALPERARRARGVHLVTVNDYLAKRDAEWNRGVFERLGMTVGFIQNMMPFAERARGLRRRHHLRHELRVRLRLPPRQHGRLARGRRPAQPRLRDRGRGRLDPDRRGADAADHLRRARDGGEDVLRLRARRAGARRRADEPQGAEGRGRDRALRRRLHVRREAQDRLAGPAGDREGRARAPDRQPLRPATTSSSSTT